MVDEMASCDLCSSRNCLCCRFCLTSNFLSHVGWLTLPVGGEDFQADIVTSSVHSSLYSASTPPARRMMASRPGEMPTTPVRRRISLFSRYFGCCSRRATREASVAVKNRGPLPHAPGRSLVSTVPAHRQGLNCH